MELPSIRGMVKGAIAFSLALCPLFLSACAAGSPPSANVAPIPAARFEQELTDSCGQHVVYPISDKCVVMMGSVGPLLQRRSDLIMAIWRSCPDQNPCSRIVAAQPACGSRPSGAQPVIFTDADDSCKKAQEADYSCAALLKDPVYSESLHQPAIAPDPYECYRAKAALAGFDREVERISLRIQWYRIFAAQGY